MVGSNNYDLSQLKNPVTGQERVDVHHIFGATLAVDPIAGGADGYSSSTDCRADSEKTLIIKTAQDFTVTPQLTDDDGANPDWYDYCDADGTPYNFSVVATHKAIQVSAKAIGVRVKLHNNSGVSDTPVVKIV